MGDLMISVFRSYQDAEAAIAEVRRTGFGGGISLVTKEKSAYFDEMNNLKHSFEGEVEKLQYGGVIGGLVGLTLGSIVAPGIGTILAAGPLAGLFAGALVGEVAEAARHFDLPTDKKHYFTNQINEGKVIVVIESEEQQIDQVKDIVEKHHVEEIVMQ